jgi:2-keto-3-deoxy-L-rhamnonate aldolase RhmA
MKPNRVKQTLQAGGTVIGSEISRLHSADIPRIYAAAGFDFVFIDMEHTSFTLETVADMIQTARGSDIVPIVRVPQAEYAYVARALDAGAQGIIVPRVNTPAEVERIVSWTRYPPHGIRGFASTTAQTDGHVVAADEFIEAAHRATLLVIQIERCEAIANLSEMLSIDGVDVACLGLMDLSVDLGVPGEVDHPSTVAAVQRLVDVSRENGVASGIISGRDDTIATWMAQGVRFVSYATEEILLQQAAQSAVKMLRENCHREPAR